jgi:hypothetical protein
MKRGIYIYIYIYITLLNIKPQTLLLAWYSRISTPTCTRLSDLTDLRKKMHCTGYGLKMNALPQAHVLKVWLPSWWQCFECMEIFQELDLIRKCTSLGLWHWRVFCSLSIVLNLSVWFLVTMKWAILQSQHSNWNFWSHEP